MKLLNCFKKKKDHAFISHQSLPTWQIKHMPSSLIHLIKLPPAPQLTQFTDLNKAHLLFQIEIPGITKSRICL